MVSAVSFAFFELHDGSSIASSICSTALSAVHVDDSASRPRQDCASLPHLREDCAHLSDGSEALERVGQHVVQVVVQRRHEAREARTRPALYLPEASL